MSAYDHEEVVEIVRDAAGELTDSFHFLQMGSLALRALQSGCRFLFAGDVAARDIDKAVILGHRPMEPSPGSVLVPEAIFHAHSGDTFGKVPAAGLGMRSVIRMPQLTDMHRLDFVFAPAE